MSAAAEQFASKWQYINVLILSFEKFCLIVAYDFESIFLHALAWNVNSVFYSLFRSDALSRALRSTSNV